MGLLVLLTVLFVALKLLEVIDWSWWLVIAPMYVYGVLFITVFIITVVKVAKELLGK